MRSIVPPLATSTLCVRRAAPRAKRRLRRPKITDAATKMPPDAATRMPPDAATRMPPDAATKMPPDATK